MKNNNVKTVMFRNNKAVFGLTLAVSLGTAFAELYIAVFLRDVIDIGISLELDKLIGIVITGVAVVAAYFVLMLFGQKLQNMFLRRASVNIKNQMAKQLMDMNVKEVMSSNSGENISLLTNDMKILETDYILAPIQIFSQLSLFIFAIVIMCLENFKMSICVGLMCMLPMLLVSLASRGMEKNQAAITDCNASYTTYSKDILAGLTVIKSFNIKEYILKTFGTYVNRLESNKNKYNNKVSLITCISNSVGFFIVIVIFLLGIFMVSKGEMTVGGIVAFVQLLNYLLNPVGILMDKFAKVKGCKPIVAKINRLMIKESHDQGKEEKSTFDKCIHIEKLNFRYGEDDEYVLKDISLKLEKGRSYALVGLSGCGKSTLVKLIAGYYDNYEGKLLWDDVEVGQLSEKSVYSISSMVQQESFIFDDTIENNIRLYRDWKDDRVKAAESEACLTALIAEKGDTYNCGENGCNLSGGEKQRITIARALLNDAPVMLMDEATSALDMNTTYEIEKNIARIKDKTRIVITHKLIPDILKVYDEIIFMDNGRIAEQGSYDDLMKKKGGFYSLCMLNGGEKDEDKESPDETDSKQR